MEHITASYAITSIIKTTNILMILPLITIIILIIITIIIILITISMIMVVGSVTSGNKGTMQDFSLPPITLRLSLSAGRG